MIDLMNGNSQAFADPILDTPQYHALVLERMTVAKDQAKLRNSDVHTLILAGARPTVAKRAN